jgi:hypothetical protein
MHCPELIPIRNTPQWLGLEERRKGKQRRRSTRKRRKCGKKECRIQIIKIIRNRVT